MIDILSAAALAFGIVFLAELGDKTQLLALSFGSRYSLRQVAPGLVLGYGAASVVAVAVGGVLGAAFPRRPVEIIGGVIFLVFAALALLESDDDPVPVDGETSLGPTPTSRGALLVRTSVVASIAMAVFVAEMGDKTQIATATIASRVNPVGTWLGATLGEVSSGMVGAVAGTFLGGRLPQRQLRIASAVLFAVFGMLMLKGSL